MDELVLVAVLIVGVVALTPAADRLRIPQPVLLTLFGLAVALLPGTHQLTLNPDLILPVVLPPLLFAATQRTTVVEFREHARSVFTLAVGLTVSTAVVIAVLAHATGLPWPAAWVLGAMVSPPDPVAATAVARRLRLPHRLVTILEGEGMFNDATALVTYKVAVAAAVTGTITFGGTALELGLAVAVGAVVGLVVGVVAQRVLARIHDGYAETTVTVLVPFLGYIGAEHLRGSGVLAVLTLGLFLRTYGHEATTSQGWLLGRAVWSYADFLITSLVFALLGFELVEVIGSSTLTSDTLWRILLVVTALVGFRAAWIFPTGWLSGLRARRRDTPVPFDWRESTVVSWAGMRGVVTVAAALALPATVDGGAPFPHREEIVAIGLACVLLTLVVQGLTLAPLTAWLGVARVGDDAREVVELRRRAAEAALAHVRGDGDEWVEGTEGAGVAEDVRRAAVTQYEGYLASQAAMDEARQGSANGEGAHPAEQLQSVLREAAGVERALVLEARRRGEVSPASADEVLRDIESRAIRDLD